MFCLCGFLVLTSLLHLFVWQTTACYSSIRHDWRLLHWKPAKLMLISYHLVYWIEFLSPVVEYSNSNWIFGLIFPLVFFSWLISFTISFTRGLSMVSLNFFSALSVIKGIRYSSILAFIIKADVWQQALRTHIIYI